MNFSDVFWISFFLFICALIGYGIRKMYRNAVLNAQNYKDERTIEERIKNIEILLLLQLGIFIIIFAR